MNVRVLWLAFLGFLGFLALVGIGVGLFWIMGAALAANTSGGAQFAAFAGGTVSGVCGLIVIATGFLWAGVAVVRINAELDK